LLNNKDQQLLIVVSELRTGSEVCYLRLPSLWCNCRACQ